MIQIGDQVPDFELPSQTGERVRLSTLLERGHVVLYLYIRDATPG
jgi:peroxiredoxin Q/BCP